MHLMIITCLLYKEKDKCFVALFLGGAGGTPAPRRAQNFFEICTYDIAACGGDDNSLQSCRQCHKYYGVSCGAATTKTAAKPPVPICDSKAYSSRQGEKIAAPDTAYKNVVSGAAVVICATCVQALTCRNCPRWQGSPTSIHHIPLW